MSAPGPERRHSSYAVVWRVGDAPPCSGRLELDDDALILSGARAPAALRIAFGDVASASIGRRPQDRIDGVTSLVIDRRGGERVLAYVVGSIGALNELNELLGARPA